MSTARITDSSGFQRTNGQKSSPNSSAPRPDDEKIPEPLFSALVEAGYNGSDRLRDFAANCTSSLQIFRFFMTNTPEKPWKMIDELMSENILLKRQMHSVRRHADLFANIYDHHVGQWFTLENWLKEQGLEIPEHIQEMGREARMELLRFEGIAPK